MPLPPAPPPEGDSPLPRNQVRTACAVVGCLGVTVVAAFAALVYIVVTVLAEMTPPPTSEKDKEKKKLGMRPAPVSPTVLARPAETLALDAPFDAVGRAANGRFLLLRIPSKGELAVFDPVQAKVIHALPLGEKNALFAGGAGKLYVYRPKAKELDQYDLQTWQKDGTAKKPDGLPGVDHLVVGVGVDAPVLAISTGTGRADVAVIDPAPATWTLHSPAEWKFLADARHIRASPDGRTIGAANPREGVMLTFGGTEFRSTKPSPALAGHDAPTAAYHYTSQGAWRPGSAGVAVPGTHYTFPTAHGDDLFLTTGRDDSDKLEAPLRLNHPDYGPVGVIPAKLPTTLTAKDDSPVPMDRRVHLWPAAGLLAVLPTSNQRIELTRVDVPGLLKASGKDYLAFGSEPPLSVARGTEWRYEPVVWSSRPPILEVRGPGVVLSGNAVVWDGSAPEGAITVRATIGDRTAEQSFRVLVVEP